MSKTSQVLCWIMIFVFPVALTAADNNVALLSSTGRVSVNGALVPKSSPVYPGDKVSTDSDGNGMVRTRGAVVTLPGSSSFEFRGSQVVMGSGRILVATQNGMKARLANLTITPASGPARFQLTNTKDTVAVAALEGSLTVTNGAQSMLLKAGEMMTHAVDQEPTPAPPPAKASGGIPGWAIGLIVAGAIGGVIGGLAARGSSAPASPSVP